MLTSDRKFVFDRDTPTGRLTIYTTEQISNNRKLTPEGFLLCMGTPVARIGEQLYGPDETPITVGDEGFVIIERGEDQVFRPEFLASLENKPITNDHPIGGLDPVWSVTPENFRDVSKGTASNFRRGEGAQADLLLADLLICDGKTIKDVLDGKVEISLGYKADYEELGPGLGRQINMLGNHIAIVDAARCGPRCSIGDHSHSQGVSTVTHDSAPKKKGSLEKLLKAVKDAISADKPKAAVLKVLDEGAEELEMMDEGEGEATIMKRIDELEGGHKKVLEAVQGLTTAVGDMKKALDGDTEEEEKKKKEMDAANEEMAEETGKSKDEIGGCKDSAYFDAPFRAAVSDAEILMPGLSLPKYDRAAAPRATMDAICDMRRNALELAWNQADTRGLIQSIHGKAFDAKTVSCKDMRTLFRAAAAARKGMNSSATRGAADMRHQVQGTGGARPMSSPAAVNARNAARFAKN